MQPNHNENQFFRRIFTSTDLSTIAIPSCFPLGHSNNSVMPCIFFSSSVQLISALETLTASVFIPSDLHWHGLIMANIVKFAPVLEIKKVSSCLSSFICSSISHRSRKETINLCARRNIKKWVFHSFILE
jgi:hypothetical protein